MPQGKGTYGSKKGRPKKPNAHHPMSFNFKRIQAVKTGKDSFEVDGKSFPVTSKAMTYKPQMNKGPYDMKLGGESATRNTPGPFRAEVPYMYNTPNAIKPMMTGQSREEMKKLEEERQERARQRVRDKRAKAGFDTGIKKPKMFRGQIRKASDTARKADKVYRSEGNKNDPDYMKMMNKRK